MSLIPSCRHLFPVLFTALVGFAFNRLAGNLISSQGKVDGESQATCGTAGLDSMHRANNIDNSPHLKEKRLALNTAFFH
jgi:hypothetical protein